MFYKYSNATIENELMKILQMRFFKYVEWILVIIINMATPIKRLFKAAKKDLAFQQKLKEVGEVHNKPEQWWDNNLQVLFATVYMGYLVANGLYTESDYDY